MFKRGVAVFSILLVIILTALNLTTQAASPKPGVAAGVTATPQYPVHRAGARGHVTAMRLVARPNNYNGRCPVTIHFLGSVVVNGPTSIEYGIMRSDGARARGERLNFAGAGSRRVGDSWQLGQSYSGWEMIGSGNMRSNRATFRVHCRR